MCIFLTILATFHSMTIRGGIYNFFDAMHFFYYSFLNLQFLIGTGNGCYITHDKAFNGLVGPVGLVSKTQFVEIVDSAVQSFVPHAYTNVRRCVSVAVQNLMYSRFTCQLEYYLDSMLLYQVKVFSVRNY